MIARCGIVLTGLALPATAYGELIGLGWVQAPISQAAITADSRLSTHVSFDLMAEFSPGDRFVSGRLQLNGVPIYNSFFDSDMPPLGIFPQDFYDSHISGPLGSLGVTKTGSLSFSPYDITWNFNPPSGSTLPAGRQRLARITFNQTGLYHQLPGYIEISSRPGEQLPLPFACSHLGPSEWTSRIPARWHQGLSWHYGHVPQTFEHIRIGALAIAPITVIVDQLAQAPLLDLTGSQPIEFVGAGSFQMEHFSSGWTAQIAAATDTVAHLRVPVAVDLDGPSSISGNVTIDQLLPGNGTLSLGIAVRPDVVKVDRVIQNALTMIGAAKLTGDTVSVVDSLTITNTGTLDLARSGMIVDYADPSPLALLTEKVVQGRIKTSDTTPSAVVGIGEASELSLVEFMGAGVDDSAIVMRWTIRGDANLDGTVNISDFARLAANFNSPGTWTDGDFDYNGTTSITDFAALAANFNQNLPAARSVPEPATLIAPALLFVCRRRRM